MVVDADAVIEPWAVVVEALYAPVADGAVAGARRANHQAVGAHLTRVDLGQHVEEVVLGFQVAWVSCRGNEEAEGNDRSQCGNDEGNDIGFLFYCVHKMEFG